MMAAVKRKPPRPAKRLRHRMPAFVRKALVSHGLMEAYRARPPYQRNDYVGWVTRAKRAETRERRLMQMLQELAAGDRYMKMPYRGRVSAPGRRGRSAVTAQTAREILLALPGVEEGPCYGTAGFQVRRKLIARLRDDDQVLVVKCGFDERDFRIQADPETYFSTDHYRGYPTVLVRLAKVGADDLRALLETAWRRLVPKRLVAEYEKKGNRQP